MPLSSTNCPARSSHSQAQSCAIARRSPASSGPPSYYLDRCALVPFSRERRSPSARRGARPLTGAAGPGAGYFWSSRAPCVCVTPPPRVRPCTCANPNPCAAQLADKQLRRNEQHDGDRAVMVCARRFIPVAAPKDYCPEAARMGLWHPICGFSRDNQLRFSGESAAGDCALVLCGISDSF